MSRQTRTLAILAVLVVVFLGGYFALRSWNQSQEEASHTYLAQMSQVTHLSFDKEGQTLSFSWDETGGWTYDGDTDFPVNSSMLEDIAELFTDLEAVRVIEEPQGLADYGLDQPQRTVIAQGETDSVTLLLGDPVEENYYAMVEGGTQVYTIPSDLFTNTDYTLFQLVQTETLSAFQEDDIQQVTLSQGEQNLTLTVSSHTETQETGEVDENGEAVTEEVTSYTWNLDGQELPQDSQAVDTLLSCLGLQTFGDCVAFKPTQEELEAMGLDEASALTVTVTGTEDKSLELLLGNPTGAEDQVYAKQKDSQLVFTLSQETQTKLKSLFSADWTVVAAEEEES